MRNQHRSKKLLVTAGLLCFATAAPRADAVARGKAAGAQPRRASARPRPRPGRVITGDDYPAAWKNRGKDAFSTVFGLNRECVSFAAWKVYVDSGGRSVPGGTAPPADWARFSINVDAAWGNAGHWGAYGASHGVRVDRSPAPGSIAHWNARGAMTVGHVGVVKAVNRDGSVDIEQYNLREDGRYSVLHMARNSSALDRSNGHPPWSVPWPDDFIHIHGR
jgi:hypothetical protein